jgi:uncharacterized protein DUF6551
MTASATKPDQIDRTPQLPPDKQLREIGRRFKHGYIYRRSGGGHFRIRDHEGRFVEYEGRPITVSGNPGPQTIEKFERQVREAGVLRGTKTRHRPEAVKARTRRIQEIAKQTQVERQEAARVLRDRFERAFKPIGGLVPGLPTDLGEVAAMLVHENPDLDGGRSIKTPDRLQQNAYRAIRGEVIVEEYERVWIALLDRLERAPDKTGEWYTLVRQAKRLPDDTVRTRLPKNAQDDWPFRVELLPLDALLIDEAYQRPVGWAFVRREAARFDPTLVGTIDVAQRSPSTFAVLDGQQRREIVRLAGKQTIWASVYVGLDLASEARFFLHKNRDRKIMHPYYTFRARVAADEPKAIDIEAIIRKHGYQLAIGAPTRDHNHSNIAAIAAVEVAYDRKLPDGSPALDPTLEILKRSTLGRAEGQGRMTIRGVSQSLMERPELDRDLMVEVLAELGPQLIIGRARDLNVDGSRDQLVARVLLTEYDRRSRARRKAA